jgi:phospholipase/carboxylesterase
MVNELNVKEKIPSSGSVKKIVIFLHGYGADGADLFSLSEPLSEQLPDCFFASPDAPRKCGASPFGYEWFPIPDIDGSTIPDMMQALASSEKLIIKLIDGYKNRFGLDYSDIILLGFSQGCMISLNIGLRQLNDLGGIVGISGRLLMPESLEENKKEGYPPVILIHGDADDVVPISLMHDAEKALNKLNVNYSTHVSKNIGHGIAPDGLSKALEFMKNIFS